jgi:serine/threonine protein kinase
MRTPNVLIALLHPHRGRHGGVTRDRPKRRLPGNALQDLRALFAELDEQFPSARTASPFRTPDATTDQAFCDLWGDGVTHGAQDGDKAHSICGTAEYMSPEMVEHLGYGFMSEVWSYGVFIYEMLTGATPFECDSPQYDSQVIYSPLSYSEQGEAKRTNGRCFRTQPHEPYRDPAADRRGGPSSVVTFAQRVHPQVTL